MTQELELPVTVPARVPGDDERLAHLVLRDDWPIALCGATVTERLGAAVPGRDRCYDCLKIAQAKQLGRPGWA
jgi:hypothetical protein